MSQMGDLQGMYSKANHIARNEAVSELRLRGWGRTTRQRSEQGSDMMELIVDELRYVSKVSIYGRIIRLRSYTS